MLHRLLKAHFAAFVVVLGNGGCRGDECIGGTVRCNGDVLETCEESSGGAYLSARSCEPGACIPHGDRPFCALDRKPDARCVDPSRDVCDAATLVTCHAGYATAAFDCALGESPGAIVVLAEGTSGACVDATTGAQCVAEAEPEPVCPTNREHFSGCSGNDQVECRNGYVVQRIPCGTAFCRKDLTAVCSLTETPDPACFQNDRTSSFCEGNTLVRCGWAFRVSEQPCSASEVCAPFSVGNAVCKPRE